jgi:hypothetical protein
VAVEGVDMAVVSRRTRTDVETLLLPRYERLQRDGEAGQRVLQTGDWVSVLV